MGTEFFDSFSVSFGINIFYYSVDIKCKVSDVMKSNILHFYITQKELSDKSSGTKS